MRSVADQLRGEMVERVRQMTPAQRVALTARLAADDLALFAQAQGLDVLTARRLLGRRRQSGRIRSLAMEGILEA